LVKPVAAAYVRRMRVTSGLVAGAVALGLTAAAHADPAPADPYADEAVHAGAQTTPPVHAGEPALPQQLDGRHAVRGCAVGDTCVRAADVLREFELEVMPPPGGNPWIDERTPPRSHLEATPPHTVSKPSQLRPDQPWLDHLQMPDLPVTWTQKLVDYLVFYKDDPRGRAIMSSWLVAQGRYQNMIESHLRAAHLPLDLIYDAMIESSYDPDDSSSAGALGLWQFMPEGGRIYGLREDRWVDERKDPLRSTIAQMDYFADLFQRFGDWQLALAAFNVGYGATLRSIARYNTNDYYQLCEYENGLPWETCLYTPKVLAAAIVGHNRALFGYDKIVPAPPETWDEVALPQSVSLGALARVAGTTEAELKKLNPQLRHGRTPPEAGYIVRVPAGGKGAVEQHLAELESEWNGYDAYVMAHGERFEDVATTFGTSVGALRRLNDVKDDTELDGGTIVVVPRVSEADRAKNRAKAKAKLLGSGVDQKDGEPLIVAVPDKDAVVAGKKRVFYRVVIGDSLHGIAKAFGASEAELAAWNGLDGDAKIHPKMVIAAWVAPDFDAEAHRVALLDNDGVVVVTRGSDEHLDLAEQRTGRVREEYTATGKEKLEDVAKKFGLKSHDLARINKISYDTVLAKGDTIIVYRVSDPKRSARAEEQWRHTPRARHAGTPATKHTADASPPPPPSPSPSPSPASDSSGPVTHPTQTE
jgi:membrane-bound lytic murein transglycosylase D